MMYYDERDQGGMNLFILISLIIHAILFMIYPLFISPSSIDGIGDGGVIQVIYTETGTGTQVSPIVDPNSTSEASQTEPPRPTEEPPKEIAAAVPTEQEVDKPELPRPKPVEEPKPEVIVAPEPKPEVVTEVPEPERPEVIQPQPKPQPEIEVEPSPATSELITSETGIDVVVDELASDTTPVPEVVVEQEQIPEIVTPEPTTTRPQAIDNEVSSSGTSEMGSNSDGEDGIIKSGTGEAEYSPPPPPPVPSGTSLISGNGNIGYPKNAQDSGTQGTVILEVLARASGEIVSVEVIESSGDFGLDNQARLQVRSEWNLGRAELDYIVTLVVDFTIRNGVSVTPTDVRWAETE